jgi:photosystem II stability/assembly factor-like uncharacterized protein
MTSTFALAADAGVAILRIGSDGSEHVSWGLSGHRATSLLAREGVILAGTRDGVFRSDDGGASWLDACEGLSIRLVRRMANHPNISDREFAGTEPAGIFVSHDGARSWRSAPEVETLRDRGGWFLPYSPEAGCVRGFAFQGERAYAAVEVGGLLRSDDWGETWSLVRGSTGKGTLDTPAPSMVHSDVHSVTCHPSSPDICFAPTSGGFYMTFDGGDSWRVTHERSYCRAVWVDPDDASRIVLGPAEGVARNGRIEESRDGGATWSPVSDGLDLPWSQRMVERFSQMGHELLAITDDGRVYASNIGDLRWSRRFASIPDIRAVVALD